jgi:uncharacterized membrane protein
MFGLSEEPGTLRAGIEIVALSLETFAIGVIAVGIIYGTVRFLAGMRVQERRMAVYHAYKNAIGRTLLLGLELLVAADIIRTVALDPTLESVAVLGLLVLIRTFLSWSLVVEIEGRWPWRPKVPGAETKDEQM